MKTRQVTVLIGSYARGTPEWSSDIDIVRVGHTKRLVKSKVERLKNVKAPISYVDYEPEVFGSLYKSGSLFIHHVLSEGSLIQGNDAYWAELRRNFVVSGDFSAEICEHLSLCHWLARPAVFSHAVMPLLSHMFRGLKNAAIFLLAQRGLYIYDKRNALRTAFGFLTDADIEVLLEANNCYDRGVEGLSTLHHFYDIAPRLSNKVKVATARLLINARTRNSQGN